MPERSAAGAHTDRVHTNRLRAESFGAHAETYDRVRPSYPAALVDDLVADAPEDALDVGCGTGKAARLLADRHVRVIGVEVDDRMADVARAHGVVVETATFETWADEGRRFDLIVSGQAWHWIDPQRGALRASALLRPARALAVFWNVADYPDDVRSALDAAYRRAAPELARNSVLLTRGGGAGVADHVAALQASERFADVGVRRYRWTRTYTREQWLALLRTHSDHATLPPAQLADLLEGVGAAIDGLGGQVSARYLTEAVFARAG